MAKAKTVEVQYQELVDAHEEKGPVQLGMVASYVWRTDPRHIGFVLARYKFCGKMLAGKSSALEVGCGDGFGVAVVLQDVGSVHCIDFDPVFIKEAELQNSERQHVSFQALDITKERVAGNFDAAYSVDTIEHIQPEDQDAFMANICKSLNSPGMCVIGTPNIHADRHASAMSQRGHVNLQDSKSLKELLGNYFHNTFIFSMNDEVVHTGFYPMAHYLFGLGVGIKTLNAP